MFYHSDVFGPQVNIVFFSFLFFTQYHHPSNVLNGGGIKDPINPSDPPFPIRPNEPPCQYYLKHGTCKFGQTCKFNHPLSSPKLSGCNASGTSSSPQFSSYMPEPTVLPQRPSEPDCIYYLRNGRCKYGASCKYHHPIHNETGAHNKKKLKDRSKSAGSVLDLGGSAVTLSDGANAIPIHIISTTNNSSIGQGHIILKEGTFALMMSPTTNNASGSYSSFQPNNSNGTATHLYLQQFPTGSPGAAIAPQPQAFYPTVQPPESLDSNFLGRVNNSHTLLTRNTSAVSMSKYPLNSHMTQLTSEQMGSQGEEFSPFNESREKVIEKSSGRSSGTYSHPPSRKDNSTRWMTGNSTSSSLIWEGHHNRSLSSNNFTTETRENNPRSWDYSNTQDPYCSTDDTSHRAWDDGLSNVRKPCEICCKLRCLFLFVWSYLIIYLYFLCQPQMTTSLLSMLDTSDERHPRNGDGIMEPLFATPPRKVTSQMFRNQSAPNMMLNTGSEQQWPTLFLSTSSAHGPIRDDHPSTVIFPP